jgi:hypothetical protein
MSQSVYTVFNNIAHDMLTDMSDRFPGNQELAACLAFHNMACKANIRLPYEKFVEYAVVPYGDRLLAHDDAFFMEQSYEKVTGERGSGFVEALKNLWKHMAEDDRQSVHDYLDLLLSVHGKLSQTSSAPPAASQ